MKHDNNANPGLESKIQPTDYHADPQTHSIVLRNTSIGLVPTELYLAVDVSGLRVPLSERSRGKLDIMC